MFQLIARFAFVYCRIESKLVLTDQTIMQSCSNRNVRSFGLNGKCPNLQPVRADLCQTLLCLHQSELLPLKLKWPTLERNRFFLSLVEYYKIVFGINELNFDDFFEFNKYNSTRANHPYKPYVKPAKCNSCKYSFPIRIVRDWNSLPGSIVEAGSSLNSFKSVLKRVLNIH